MSTRFIAETAAASAPRRALGLAAVAAGAAAAATASYGFSAAPLVAQAEAPWQGEKGKAEVTPADRYERPREVQGRLPKEIIVYQYDVCPFCCKVKAFLDYHKIPYRCVEVNPLTKAELKWSDYKKVPVIVIDGEQVNDSSAIISRLAAEIEASQDGGAGGSSRSGSSKGSGGGLLASLFGGGKAGGSTAGGTAGGAGGGAPESRAEEEKWRRWVDDWFVKVITVNIYRNMHEAFQTFDYLSEHGNFGWVPRQGARVVGATLMWGISGKLKKKYGVEGDVREALYKSADEWVESLQGRPFMGGGFPDLADLAVFGVVRAVTGTDTFNDLMQNSKIGSWYARMFEARMKSLQAQGGGGRADGDARSSKTGAAEDGRVDDGNADFVIKAGGGQTARHNTAAGVSPLQAAPSSAGRQKVHVRMAAALVESAAPALSNGAVPTPAQSSAKHAPSASADSSSSLQPLRGYHSMAQFWPGQELYRSSQSVVIRATCIATGKTVIVKQYLMKRMSSRAMNKIRREVKLMYLLRGRPGVCQILGDFQDDAHFSIVMELCQGGDLYKRAMKGHGGDKPLTQQWICTKVIMPLLRVLAELHDSHGIIHRDIKPENIFLTANDELLLGDFGLAIQQQHEPPFLRAGTLDYMAPEVLQNPLVDSLDEGRHHRAADLRRLGFLPYNEKVDVWALGVLAYELMMRGQTPFYHDDPQQTERLIMRCDLVEVPFPRQHMLSPWADFVRTTLQLDPARRPSAAQLLKHRWVQQHQAARLRPTMGPRDPAFVAAAAAAVRAQTLGRSESAPARSLVGAAREAVAGLSAAQLAAITEGSPAASPGLQLLAEAAAAAGGPQSDGASAARAPSAAPFAHAASSGALQPMLSGVSSTLSTASSRCASLGAEASCRCSFCLGGGDSDMAEVTAELSAPGAGSAGPPPHSASCGSIANSVGSCAGGGGGGNVVRGTFVTAEGAPISAAAGGAPALRDALGLPPATRSGSVGGGSCPPACLSGTTREPAHCLQSLSLLGGDAMDVSPPSRQLSLTRKPSRLGLAPVPGAGMALAPPPSPAVPSTGGGAASVAAAAGALRPSRRVSRSGSLFRPAGDALGAGALYNVHSMGLFLGGANAASTFGGSAGSPAGSMSGASGTSGNDAGDDAGDDAGAVHAVHSLRPGQRNRLVAYLHRQTMSAVGVVRRRLHTAKRSVSAGGGDSDCTETGDSPMPRASRTTVED
ncbi:prostaglandin E synthase 2-like [Micractinium conductrix]|uniref:Prostaglandin E synthase 2 n=1 Tax=Micractinium conductrix TaxID=554055 RepID=A0A2P6VBD6_9CHLO|nr:prostaglandin E synthase 2-like [Micractinium conductrix]|eukprot:PSC71399.1 prostaglandin E synthase 2-like [Micractinium conductrix]